MAAILASWFLVAPHPDEGRGDPVWEIAPNPIDDGAGLQSPPNETVQHRLATMTKKSRSKTARRRRASRQPGKLRTNLNPAAAGLDISAREIVAAIPPDRPGDTVCSFDTFTSGLHALRDWLLENKITTVAMESTGSYWIACFTILEEAGIEVCLVNARHIKGVPGKKSDVLDAQWIQQLHAAGLLRSSFRPAHDIAVVRSLQRHRSNLIADSSSQIQLMQKALTEMNLHLHHVLNDLAGLSGTAIIEAILAGERDPAKLADLCNYRCRTPRQRILEALRGDYRPEQLLILGQCHKTHIHLQSQIAELDLAIQKKFASIEAPHAAPEDHKPTKPTAQPHIFREGIRFYGVDLSTIDSVSAATIATLMGELGTGEQTLKAFPTSERFSSWLGLCPDNRISGGKILGTGTRRVVNKVANALRLCAQALGHTKSRLGDYCRKMKARLGKAEAITATAHKLARILYAMIQTRTPYNEELAFKDTPKTQERRFQNLTAQAQKLGFTLVPIQPVPSC
jgi:transposase